jgi:hypothetical protein
MYSMTITRRDGFFQSWVFSSIACDVAQFSRPGIVGKPGKSFLRRSKVRPQRNIG